MKRLAIEKNLFELLEEKGMIGTRVMNKCRRMGINNVADIATLANSYGSLERKFDPYCQTGKTLQTILYLAA